jgi:hypothetical protein
MIKKYVGEIISMYNETHKYGQFICLGIFTTHGILDYLTTATGYLITKQASIPFQSLEKNPILKGSNLIEMFLIIVSTAFIISLIPIFVYKINRKYEDDCQKNRRFADFLFSLILLIGIVLVVNNLLSLYKLMLFVW